MSALVTKEMKISVAVATFNGEKYLEEQLASFLSQTLLPDEISFYDDNSSDRTVEIVEAFKERNKHIQVSIDIGTATLGYTQAFQRAIERTTGNYVFLADQDDRWYPEKIERMMMIAVNDTRNLAFLHNARIISEDGSTSARLSKFEFHGKTHRRKESLIIGCCSLIKRELLDICLPIPQKARGHDNWILGFADLLDRKRLIDEILIDYRRHTTNASQTFNYFTVSHNSYRFSSALESWRQGERRTAHICQELEKYLMTQSFLEWKIASNGESKLSKRLMKLVSQKLSIIRTRLKIRNARLICRPLLWFSIIRWRGVHWPSIIIDTIVP